MENDELAQHLDSLKREDCYRVDATLKESHVETTQRVYFVGSNGAESGPFIRKFISREAGLGGVYRRMHEARQGGARFRHIPDVLECYSRDGQMVVVMEYAQGETLQDVVYRSDPSPELAIQVFPRICDAVEELHTGFDPPVIHRDLKPSNIILNDRSLTLIDFGISREYDEAAESDTTHFGTREFAPPEQYGFGQTGVYSDVYSLGMVLYYCLTEQIPTTRARAEEYRDPRIPEPFRQVIVKAVALDPTQRFSSAGEMKQAFLRAAEGVGAAAGRPGQAGAQEGGNAVAGRRGPAGSRRIAGVAAAVVLAVVCAGAVGGVLVSTQQDSAGQDASGGQAASTAQVGSTDGSSSGAAPGADAASADGAAPDGEASGAASASAATGDTASGTVAETVVEGIRISAPPRDGFDPATNFAVTVAGVEFQVPSYFKARVTEDGSATYYNAESGSSAAMIMFKESPIDQEVNPADYKALKDEFLAGVMKTGGPMGSVIDYADCDMAGCTARLATIGGSLNGLPIHTKLAYLYNPETSAIATVMFGQSGNAQFDYSDDFAKTIASARRA